MWVWQDLQAFIIVFTQMHWFTKLPLLSSSSFTKKMEIHCTGMGEAAGKFWVLLES